MNLLNLIGLVLGYVGSILLSAGLLKSKQEALDQEKPFWGPNPFRLKDALSTRLLALWGMVFLLAGFAVSAVATAFSTVLMIDSVPLAVVVSIMLTLLGFAVTAFIIKLKGKAHIKAKEQHFQKAFIERIKTTITEYENNLIPKEAGYNFKDVRKQHIDTLLGYRDDLSTEYGDKVKQLTDKIKRSKNFTSIKTHLVNFLETEN